MTVDQSAGGAVVEEGFDYAPLDVLLEKFRGTKGAMIPLLQGTQAAYGFVPKEAMVRIAGELGEPLSSVFGVATFYAQFRLIPRGKNVVRVCHGTACHVSGAPLVSLEVERHLGIGDGENTPDMLFTLETVACLGACGMAPVMMINDRTFGKLTPDKAVGAIKEFRAVMEGGNGNDSAVGHTAGADAADAGEEA
jgi:NADH-quinone oxidoreductase subunit E